MRLRRRESKTGQSWVIDYVDHTGKRQRHTLKGIVTPKHAELAFSEFRLKFERQQIDLPTESNLTLKVAITRLIENRKLAGCSKHWIVRLQNCRDHLLEYFGADCRIAALTENKIAEYRIKRIDEGLSVETVNKELKCLTAAGRLAVRQNKLGKLPWQKVDMAIDRTGREAWSYMTEEESARLLDVLRNGKRHTFIKKDKRRFSFNVNPSPRIWSIVTFLLNTGARKGEMFALRWSDVNLENRTVRLVGTKSAKNGKSARARYVPMNADLWDLVSGMKRGSASDRVFPLEKNLRKKFSQALKWAGLRYFRLHDLRHTFASHLAMQGVALYTIAQLLGHSSIEMTKRYAHLAPENLAAAVERLNFGSARVVDVSASGGSGEPRQGTSPCHKSVTDQSRNDHNR